MFTIVADYITVLAILTMGVFMLWYWLIAYKYDLMSPAYPYGFWFLVLPPTFLIVGTAGLAVGSAMYPAVIVPGFLEIEKLTYLPFGAAFLVVAALGATFSSVMVDGSAVRVEKHKLWYVAIAYQVIMITHIFTGW